MASICAKASVQYFGWEMPTLCHMPLLRINRSYLNVKTQHQLITTARSTRSFTQLFRPYGLVNAREVFTLQDMMDHFDIQREVAQFSMLKNSIG